MFLCENRFALVVFLLLSVGIFYVHSTSDVEKYLVFRLYTPESPNSFIRLNASDSKSISESAFNPNRTTVIFVHGYMSKEKVLIRYKDAYLKLDDCNFIGVDWIRGAGDYNYLFPRGQVPLIAQKLASLLDTLVADHGLHLKNVTIVGHSLGAHIAGRAAKLLESKEKVGNIIGLDPAGVGFYYNRPENRLNKTDAEYVQVIHTDGDKFGLLAPIGHADFYPNAGKDQPGCPQRNFITTWIEKCSHVRAHNLFLESLTTEFKAIRCGSFEKTGVNVLCKCDSNTIGIMGGDVSKNTKKPMGMFYLETNDESPFVINNTLTFKNHNFTLNKFVIL